MQKATPDSKVVNLHSVERGPRPPTLDFFDYRASRGSRGDRSYKSRAKWTAVDYVIWTAVAVLVIAYGAIVSFGMGWVR